MAGTGPNVGRIVSAAAVVVLIAGGCGGATRQHGSGAQRLPRALAQKWAASASQIADAAAAGDGCRARQLANSLGADVAAAQSRVPLRLRSPLVSGVKALADRLTCTPVTASTSTGKPPKPPHRPHHHDHHGHGGDNGDQG